MATNDDYKISTTSESAVLDDIEDMPGFVTPPNGAYTVLLDKGIVNKTINNEEYFELAMTIKDVLEITGKLEEGEKPPIEGDICSIIFNRENKLGMDNYKKVVGPIARHLGTNVLKEINEGAKGLEVLVVLTRKYNKEKDRWNIGVKQLAIP